MGPGLPIARSLTRTMGLFEPTTNHLLAEPGLSSSCLRALPRAYD
jgi:hypothetical protein